ncbi:MAG TPA: class I SAM-dependent methyltransferase [Burkholderiales bacterium]|jgi:SAM-dependent methyltransferase|nr:class I SAM-dependent methyltransferase [Burkholderiales bacterium]
MSPHGGEAPSAWVVRWAPLITHGTVLDVACGRGRHARYFLARGLKVVAVDREPQDIPGARFIRADLEDGSPWPLAGERFEGIVVTNYLHRPLLPTLMESLAEGGVLVYETFMLGNERYGRPSNPAFLLRPGELLEAFRGLHVEGFEEGPVAEPKPAVIQRLCAVRRGKG